MKKGKVGPAEFEFEETVKALKEEASELPPPPPTGGVGIPTVSLATSDPKAAVVNAWLEVEAALTRLVQVKGVLPTGSSRNSSQAIRAVQKAELIEPNYLALYSDLRGLRNRAVHEADFNPSIDSVLSYVQLAKELAAALQKAAEGH